MKGSFEYLVDNLNITLQPFVWSLYQDLIDTIENPEHITFYKWEYIEYDIRYQDIRLLLNDFDNNINNIISIVKDIIIDNIKSDNRFEYTDNNNIEVKSWHLEGLICCDNCGNIWDGMAQCYCY
jgi:hypothetical protein